MIATNAAFGKIQADEINNVMRRCTEKFGIYEAILVHDTIDIASLAPQHSRSGLVLAKPPTDGCMPCADLPVGVLAFNIGVRNEA